MSDAESTRGRASDLGQGEKPLAGPPNREGATSRASLARPMEDTDVPQRSGIQFSIPSSSEYALPPVADAGDDDLLYGGAHIGAPGRTPARRRTMGYSPYYENNYTDDESPSQRAAQVKSEKRAKSDAEAQLASQSEGLDGDYSETRTTPKGTHIERSAASDKQDPKGPDETHEDTLAKEAKELEDAIAAEKQEMELARENALQILSERRAADLKKIKEKYRAELAATKAKHVEDESLMEAEYQRVVRKIPEKAKDRQDRKERENTRRQRGSLLATQAERDGEPINDSAVTNQPRENVPIIKILEVPTEEPKAKGRPSLGTDINALMTQVMTPKGKEKEVQPQIPDGGYLGSVLNATRTSIPRVTAPTTAHILTTINNTSTAKPPDPGSKVQPTTSGDKNQRTAPLATTSQTPLVSAPGKPGGGDDSSSSSSDSDYRRMSRAEKNAYKKGKKDREADKADRTERRKQREKIEKLKLSGYRTKLPSTYDGSADYDEYEQFIFELNTWVEDTGFTDEEAVKHLKAFLKGKAAMFYMNMVAPRPSEYTVGTLTAEMFDYCFPPDMKARLRRKFLQLRQTDRGFKDYVRELQRYQRRLTDINDRLLAQRVWEGSHSYLHVEWARAGYSAEISAVDELLDSGIRFEMAEKIRRSEEERRKGKEEREKRFPKHANKSDVTESNKISIDKNYKPYKKEYTPSSYKTQPKWKQGKPGEWRKTYKPTPRLSKEQVEEYRASNKCFVCGEVGHIVKDCPKRNQVKPTHLSSSSIRYARIEELGDKRRELEINHVQILSDGEMGDDEEEGYDAHISINTADNMVYLPVSAVRTKKNNEPLTIERNASIPKDFERKVASAIVVEMFINGKSCRVLLDSGSLGDFISSTIVDQLRIKTDTLAKPLGLTMAVAGSRGSIKHCTTVNIKYQGIDDMYRVDVANLDRYDLILGTTFMHRHSIVLSFNPHGVHVRSNELLPLSGPLIKTISSCATDVYEQEMERIREELRKESEDICKKASETPLPPLRVINHRIPLIDDNKTYSWRSSRCPEALRSQWDIKLKAYLETGRWEFATGKNAIPMLLIPKKGKEGESTLRTVLDKREQNSNTYKLASPLPDIQEILWKVSKYKYRSLIDGKDAYEQIRVEPEDVPKTLFTTPSGTMISHVMQIGDCNASATYQSIMNHLFAHAIGVYMHVFLDDIVIFTHTIEEHVRRVKEIFEVLRKQKFFLSPNKMQFLVDKLHILGHIVDSNGIQMDPHKVDSVLNWKVPNTKEQLMSFLGAVGYLAPNCAGIRIPMGTLTTRAAKHRHWVWDATAQRAFEEVKEIVNKWRDHHRVAIDYSENAPPINLVTDASLTGASGILSQGAEVETAKIAMFWSGKFTPTQQNYPVHELELYAIKESLDKFKYQLHGVKFRIHTDNKSLEHLMTQKNLSARQARWLESINEFDFTILHIPGKDNKVADALSHMYNDEPEGMERAGNEYLPEEEGSEDQMESASMEYDVRVPVTNPLYVGNAAIAPDAPEKEKEAQEPIKEVMEGASEQGTEEAAIEGEPELNKQVLRRSGRERRPVTKYAAPPKPLKQKKSLAKQQEKEIKTAKEGEDKQTALEAENEKVLDEPTHIVGVGNGDSPSVPTFNEEEQMKITHTYYDASSTLLDLIRDKYVGDKLFAKIVTSPSQFSNFFIDNGIMYIKQKSGNAICVPNVPTKGTNARELVLKETHEILRHAGFKKTLYAMRGRVWWESMVPDTKEYCQSCSVCATAKSSTQSRLGLLKPLKRPTVPWERISIDFVGPLPESENLLGKWDMMLVVVDYATNMTRIVPTRQNYRAKEIAEIMYENIYRIFGVPTVIVSDRDSLFTSTFWSETNRLMGIQTRMSSAYHPETDGATERANKTIGSMIRQSIKGRQNDWVKYLPSIEYAMNASVSETTGYSPFYLNYGRIPPPMVWQTECEYTGVRRFLVRQREALMRAHDAIIASRVRQIEQANKHRKSADFQEGDLVYISSKNMRLPPKFSRKLTPKFIGPHRIIQEVTKGTTYKIELPQELKARGIHPVFHASLLRAHTPNNDRKFPGRSAEQIISLDKEPKEWAVDKIMTHAGKGREAQFKLLWKSGDFSWEPFERIRHLEAMDSYLEAQGVEDASQLKWTDPRDEEASDDEEQHGKEEEITSLEVNRLEIEEIPAHIACRQDSEWVFKASSDLSVTHPIWLPVGPLRYTPISTSTPLFTTMYTLNSRHSGSLSQSQLVECSSYRNALNDHRLGLCEHPGVEPRAYQLYRAIMMSGSLPPHTTDDSALPRPNHARFTASEDGQIVDATGQALRALADAQEEIRRLLLDRPTGSQRRSGVDVNIPPIPEGFTGRVGTTLASRIGAPGAPKRIGWVNGLDGNRLPIYGNKTRRFSPYHRGKPSGRGKKKAGRGERRGTSSSSLPAGTEVDSPTGPTGTPIEVDEPSSIENTGTPRTNPGSSTDGTPADADVLDFEDDGWNIQDYEEW